MIKNSARRLAAAAEGSTPEVGRKKSQKVTRGSHRNDVSPLTQGLRYRAACDSQLIDSLKMGGYEVRWVENLKYLGLARFSRP